MNETFAKAIIELVASGRTLSSACKEMGFKAPLFQWFIRKNDSLADLYAQAQEARYDAMEDEIIEIADDFHRDTQWQRNRLDARYKILAARVPQRWGNKLDLTIQTKGDPRDSQRKADARLMRLRGDATLLPAPQVIDGTALLIGTLADNESAHPVINPEESSIFAN